MLIRSFIMNVDDKEGPQLSHPSKEAVDSEQKDDKAFKIKAAAFLAGVTGVSILFGFGTTLAAAKKKDPHLFDQGLTGQIEQPSESSPPPRSQQTVRRGPTRPPVALYEPGASLALKALGYGTLYAVTGCSLFFYGVWKLMGVNDMKEFREKVGGWLPAIPRRNPPQGRTEFSGLNDLLQYIIDVDEEAKKSKKKED